MFVLKTIDLGQVKQGTSHKLEFHYEDIDYIKSINSPCTCTEITNNIVKQKLQAKYQASKIPVHIDTNLLEKEYTITVVYFDKDKLEQTEQLIIR
jgi:hypothetical protein